MTSFSLSLGMRHPSSLPSGISAPGSDWDSDRGLHHQLSDSQASGLGLIHSSLPDSPAHRQQVMILPGLHNHVSQFL